jgi:hypothetical protein
MTAPPMASAAAARRVLGIPDEVGLAGGAVGRDRDAAGRQAREHLAGPRGFGCTVGSEFR